MKVNNKIFVVTGGGNGIGRELVLSLLSRGARVAVVDIRKSFLEETAELSGVGPEGQPTGALSSKIRGGSGKACGCFHGAVS